MAHPKRKYQKQGEIKEELITRHQISKLLHVQKQENHIYIIVLIGMKENFIIEEKFLSTLIKQQKSSQFNKH